MQDSELLFEQIVGELTSPGQLFETREYKDSKGAQFWALSDLKGIVQTIPGKDDLYLKKSGENVLFKLEKYTTDDIVEVVALSVTLDNKSLTHNSVGDVTPTDRLSLGNPTTPLITERYNIGNKDLIITAETKNKTIMGLMHKEYNIHGFQFHPESISTKMGMKLIKNFIAN